MSSYVIKRLLMLIPIMLLLSFIVFFIIRLIPGDPIQTMLGELATQEMIDVYRAEYRMNDPLIVQYFIWLGHVLSGNLGRSIVNRINVSKIIIACLEPTISLAFLSFLIMGSLGISLGILSGINRGNKWDLIISISCFIGISIPVFMVSILLIYLFANKLNILPSIGYKYLFKAGFIPWIRNLILPAVSLGIVNATASARMMRTETVNVMLSQYITTARSKGLKERVVVLKHAVRNALIPTITVLGLQLSKLLGGVVVVEKVFAFPGLGRQIVNSVLTRDYPVLQFGILIFGFAFLVINLISK